MTLYWMLNSHWPSFFGHIIDYYLDPGGAYFGAKKGLRPVSIVYDYYATGDKKTAKIHVVNQTLKATFQSERVSPVHQSGWHREIHE